MKDTRVNKRNLLIAIEENLVSHEAAYKEALDGYRDAVVEELEANLKLAKAGHDVDSYTNLEKPQSHVKQYLEAIEMVKWSEDEFIELDTRDFNRLVLDNWEWKDSFVRSQAFYAKKF